MKKIFHTLFIFISFSTNGATSITTPTVAGHWTLAGSPYLIFNDIEVVYGQSLVIDPGVNVIFQGAYRLRIYGIMRAKGTSSQQITFTVNDTIGWSTDDSSAAGGWHGIKYENWPMGYYPDSSALEYCDISYTKIDPGSSTLYCMCLDVQRAISIKHCNIFNNKALIATSIISLLTFTTSVIKMEDCAVFNNSTLFYANVISLFNYPGGASFIHHNKIYGNYGGYILSGMDVNVMFSNNEVSQNNACYSTLSFGTHWPGYYPPTVATIRENRIYNNTNERKAVIFCNSGQIDIIGNLICNNNHITPGPCLADNGGGGLFLFCDSANFSSTRYNVVNNIIANNFSADHGGGIYTAGANALIANNQIIGNQSVMGNGIVIANDLHITSGLRSNVKIKNNIFHNNHNSVDSSNIMVLFADTVEFDHNWIQRPRYKDVLYGTGTYLLGDSTTNIIGSNPGLIAPTLTSNVTENALTTNFSLLPTSPCINMGSIVGIFTDSVDYAGQVRIYGSAIDIGAYEFNPAAYGTSAPYTNLPNLNLEVFPNPATNIISISTHEPQGTLQLVDITGKQVMEQNVEHTVTSFDIHSIPRGIYFAVWQDGTGAKATQKIIVE